MMGSLMADLQNNLASLNKWKSKNNQAELSEDDLLIKLFDEVEYVWPKLGFPPLVTPFSQYVKNVALMNVIQMEKGGERWSMIADNIWDMILGKSGALPGKVGDEILALAKKEGRVFYKGHPQEPYPDALDSFRKEMDENGWDYGRDDEELFELAMHPEQYRRYKSGAAKADFEKEIAAAKAEASGVNAGSQASIAAQPSIMHVEVDGHKYKVKVSYGDNLAGEAKDASSETPAGTASSGKGYPVVSPLEGKFYFTKDNSETAVKVGDYVQKDEVLGYVEAMKTYNTVKFDRAGTIEQIIVSNGSDVEEDDVLLILS